MHPYYAPSFFQCYDNHRDLHSFPTRRSSDLIEWDAPLEPARDRRVAQLARGADFRRVVPDERQLLHRAEERRRAAIERGGERLAIELIEHSALLDRRASQKCTTRAPLRAGVDVREAGQEVLSLVGRVGVREHGVDEAVHERGAGTGGIRLGNNVLGDRRDQLKLVGHERPGRPRALRGATDLAPSEHTGDGGRGEGAAEQEGCPPYRLTPVYR